MKVSESWVREWVNPSVSTSELVHLLTMAGLEVDGTEAAVPDFSGVVVGEILAVDAHPDAEKLRVCEVFDGAEKTPVVCGAPNAAVGLKVPFARVGAELVNEAGERLKIKKAKLRGVESMGMLCGASELGLEDIVDGLLVLDSDAPLGECVRSVLDLNDTVIEVDLTPNRGDCLSVLGLAREVAVVTGADLHVPAFEPVEAASGDVVSVALEATDYCPNYCGRVIQGVDASKETPFWMREKLRRAGLRSIDPIVDITNFVLLELGQPMHAFDLDKIDGGITVRYAKPGETLQLLDDSEITMSDSDLVIADAKNPLALAGIMGGRPSAVTSTTRNILLESAFFTPHLHAGKAREKGMHTDSSHRFERGVDHGQQRRAIERATQLVLDLCGGTAGPVIEERATQPTMKSVSFHEAQIQRVLGFTMDSAKVEEIFARLGFAPKRIDAGWMITVPSHRFDIAIEADLLEEIARIYGYDNLPVEPPLAPMTFSLQPETQRPVAALASTLVARGYREVITYSFIDQQNHDAFFGDTPAVALTNPISKDMSTMRVSLVPGLLKAAEQNLKRQQTRLKLFESGSVFLPSSDGLQQQRKIGGLLIGERTAENWLSKSEAVIARGKIPDNFDFYDLKADVQSLLQGCGADVGRDLEFRPIIDQNDEMLAECRGILDQLTHPGQSAAIFLNNQYLGFCGAIHPIHQKTLDGVTSVWVFELDIHLISQKKVPEFKELSKYPEVRRDIAIIVDGQLSVGALLRAARASAGEEVTDVRVFDQYSGDGIESGKQSVAIGLTWQHGQRTLTEEEVTDNLNNVISCLNEQFNASLR